MDGLRIWEGAKVGEGVATLLEGLEKTRFF